MNFNDPTIDPAFLSRLVVKVDRAVQANVTAYDIEAGVVTRKALDDNGAFIMFGDEVAHEHIFGVVTVILKNRNPGAGGGSKVRRVRL